MAKKDQLITGVDIGSHAVKICQLRRSGKGYKLSAVGSALLPEGAVEDGVLQEPEIVGQIIASLFNNLKIKNKRIGLSISGYSVIVKKINLEYMEGDELQNYILAEAEQYIPFDIDDVYLDYHQLPTSSREEGRSDIMLVAAKKEVVDDYLMMMEELNLKTVLVDVDGFALENIWELSTGEEQNTIALVDIGASKMNINILKEGISVLARDVVVGSNQLTIQLANALDIDEDQAEQIKLGHIQADESREIIEDVFNQTCTQWILEIKKAVDLYTANNPSNPLTALVLSGGGSKVAGLIDYIEEETALRVIAFNPFATMKVDEKKIDAHYLQSIAPEMAIATGLAIRQAPF
ncbi:MAG: pilus assembly protein PilM [Desulfobulbus propionicus]|nr:MAG: pilus assembly protein PilM [Desulfobulbus propionicus]